MSKTVLITGGTGLIGRKLTQLLLNEGYQVRYLSRRKDAYNQVEVFQWGIAKQYIDPQAFENLDYIVHLAGAGIADKRWTTNRKREILESRTLSSELLAQYLAEKRPNLKAFISASGISIYGHNTGNTILEEDASPNERDFLGKVSVAWEKSVDQVAALNIRTVKLRTGIVLSEEGGALPKLIQPIKWGAGAALGSGEQYMSWIHMEDLCRMYLFALENEQITGAYNAVGPRPVRNSEMTSVAAKVLNRPLLLPNVPGIALNIMLGEVSDLVLGGNRVSSKKIEAAGFHFKYQDLQKTLENLLL